ncbi:MAG: insulinase family protein [Acidobacteriia bacterium]|nr:insulinase family protein [Terriglobia bacterium]
MSTADAGANAKRLPHFTVAFKTYTLKNGLRVVVAPDKSAPTYAICMAYNVGSRDERPGQTGLAHLLEHLMFEGSRNVGPGEHSYLIRTNGGSENATTNTDRTNYYEALPANQLDLGLFLEADRMAGLTVTPERLDLQRHVVLEEKMIRVDNKAYGRASEVLNDIAFENFAYRHSTFGTSADLGAATTETVLRFYRTFYMPNNAVLVVVGNVRPEEVLAAVRKRFGGIPAGTLPQPPDFTPDVRESARQRTVEDSFAKASRIDISYKVPPGNSPEWYALAVAGDVLAEGHSSLLHRTLVLEKNLAARVAYQQQQRRAAALGTFSVTLKKSDDVAAAEEVLYTELERFKKDPIDDWRVDKVRRDFVLTSAERFQSSTYRALVLSEFALFYNDPGLLNTFVDKLYRVTKKDIQRAVAKYFIQENRSVVVTVPRAGRKEPASAPSDRGSS